MLMWNSMGSTTGVPNTYQVLVADLKIAPIYGGEGLVLYCG
jgi:hypothetical protein